MVTKKFHCRKNKILKFFFLTQNFFSLWWAGDVMGKHFPFLSLSLSSLCVIYPRGRSVHSSKTPNGLQRVPTGYNTTG